MYFLFWQPQLPAYINHKADFSVFKPKKTSARLFWTIWFKITSGSVLMPHCHGNNINNDLTGTKRESYETL